MLAEVCALCVLTMHLQQHTDKQHCDDNNTVFFLHEGNWEELNRLCSHGKSFSEVVKSHEHWELVNEGDSIKQKWGFVTKTIGAQLDIHINTTRVTRPEKKTISVQLAYLKSYKDMGRALIRYGCHGCMCDMFCMLSMWESKSAWMHCNHGRTSNHSITRFSG